MEKKKPGFEDMLKKLEDIVGRMEGGGLSLDESMKLYEEGIKNTEMLTAKLAEARESVMKLITDENGDGSLESFGEGTPE